MNYYLIVKESTGNRVDRNGNVHLTTTEYYPRLVLASSPQEAIDQMFKPERYKPKGSHIYKIYELCEEGTYRVEPIMQPTHEVFRVG